MDPIARYLKDVERLKEALLVSPVTAEQVADVLLALQMEGCWPLEPLTCSVEDLIAPKDFFSTPSPAEGRRSIPYQNRNLLDRLSVHLDRPAGP